MGGVAGYCCGIYNCFNVGSVTGVTSVGAIAAYSCDSIRAPHNCYWAGDCQIDIAVGDGSSSSGCARCNQNDLKSKGWYYDTENWSESYPWQFGLYWTFVDGENDGYPVLKAFYEENYDGEAYWTENEYYADSFASGTGTADDPYLISTPEQLGRLAYVINEPTLNAQFKNCYYKQTKNLDVSSHWWKPIGTYISEDEYYAFSGYYDGGGYTISGIFTKDGSSSSYSYRGVFGYITSPAEIKNLGVINSMINGYQYVGAIVGWAGSGTIVDNCHNEVDVTSNYYDTGGIAGYSDGTISNCYNIADITGCGNYVGGIAGECSQVRYCYNTGYITADRYETSTGYQTEDYIGGIVGSGQAYYCYNTGSVSGMRCIGGIAGRGGAQNCYNTGSVSGNWESSGTGGIVGYQDYDIYNCINYGRVSCPGSSTGLIVSKGGGITGACHEVVANCINLGSVSGSGQAIIGAIYGDSYQGSSVSYCYRGGDSPTSGYGSSCTIENVKTESWFTSTSRWNSSYPWNFENVWTFVEGENDGYPVLGVASRTFVTYHNNLEVEEVHSDSKTGLSAKFVIKSYDLFERTGYQIVGWTTEPNGGTGYMPGATYTGGNLDLYAQWERISYIVSFDANGGSGTMESLEKDYNKDLVLPLNEFIWAGHDFKGWAVSANGSAVYEDGANYATNASVTLYAVWEARNPAYYDSEGGYWYVENGKLPQSKVGESLKVTLEGQWSSLTGGSVYYMGVEELAENDLTGDGGMQSKVYNGEEYVKFNGEFYLVEPIRWRLVYSSSQQEGYAVEDTSVLATMAEIVFLGSYSSAKISVGAGYSAESVTMLLKNQVSTKFLVSESREVEIFGTPKDTTSASGSVFVASSEELTNFTTNKNNTTGSGVRTGKASLSDFVKDYLRATGQGNYYFTRDLGDQLNTIRCLNPVGNRSQAKAQQTLGVQFTIKVTEYACKSV